MSKILQSYRKREEYADLFSETQRFKVYTERHLDQIAQVQRLPEEQRFAMHVVTNVLPFRVNQYVIDELIDWTNIPDDLIFQLTFPSLACWKARISNGWQRCCVPASTRPKANGSPARSATSSTRTLPDRRTSTSRY